MASVRIEEVRRFMKESLQAAGVRDVDAQAHAALLLHADMTGHFSHGLNRLGGINLDTKPVILNETAATAWVDGLDGLGAPVADFCMEIAMRKAKECGVGWVSAKGCTHFGMAGYWAQKASSEGLLGMDFTNSSPIMVPTRSKHSACGTNPIGMCAPTGDGDSILVDQASTAVAMGKIEVQVHKKEPLPEGWALGPDGKPTTDAKLAFDTGRLLPLGGFENTSGYKGYGLAAMVETFCSGLSGATASHNNGRVWTVDDDNGPRRLGQCFVAIDPGCFAPGFGDRIADNLRHWRQLEPVDPSLPVLAPGDKERQNEQKTRQKGTIQYSQGQIDSCNTYAKMYKVKPLQIV